MEPVIRKQFIVHYGLMILAIISCYIVFFVFSEELIRSITKEDGLFEYIGALSLLITSFLFFLAFLRKEKSTDFYLFKTNKNYWFLLLAILFFFGSGEEISWGQRIFNWETSEGYNQINRQSETNIHNLRPFRGVFSPNYLFTYFWMTFCVIIPVVNFFSIPVSKLIDRTGFPLVPIRLSIFFIIGYIPSLIFKASLQDGLLHSVTEVKETCLSILFIFVSMHFLRKTFQKKNNQ